MTTRTIEDIEADIARGVEGLRQVVGDEDERSTHDELDEVVAQEAWARTSHLMDLRNELRHAKYECPCGGQRVPEGTCDQLMVALFA